MDQTSFICLYGTKNNGHETAVHDEGSTSTYGFTSVNIPSHTHTFEGVEKTGQIVIRNSQYSTINSTSGAFTYETNPNTYNTQLDIKSDSCHCTMKNINFSLIPVGTNSYYGNNNPVPIELEPPYRTVYMYRRVA